MWSKSPNLKTELIDINAKLSFNQADFSCKPMSLVPGIQLTFSKHVHDVKSLKSGIRGFH